MAAQQPEFSGAGRYPGAIIIVPRVQTKMSPVFAKLNLKDQAEIVVINAPASFEPEIAMVSAKVLRDTKHAKTIEFVIVFALGKETLEPLAPPIGTKAMPSLWAASSTR